MHPKSRNYKDVDNVVIRNTKFRNGTTLDEISMLLLLKRNAEQSRTIEELKDVCDLSEGESSKFSEFDGGCSSEEDDNNTRNVEETPISEQSKPHAGLNSKGMATLQGRIIKNTMKVDPEKEQLLKAPKVKVSALPLIKEVGDYKEAKADAERKNVHVAETGIIGDKPRKIGDTPKIAAYFKQRKRNLVSDLPTILENTAYYTKSNLQAKPELSTKAQILKKIYAPVKQSERLKSQNLAMWH